MMNIIPGYIFAVISNDVYVDFDKVIDILWLRDLNTQIYFVRNNKTKVSLNCYFLDQVLKNCYYPSLKTKFEAHISIRLSLGAVHSWINSTIS